MRSHSLRRLAIPVLHIPVLRIPVLHIPVLFILALQGCTAYVPGHPPVPPVMSEDVPAPPPSRVALIWRPGHYDWTGTGYVWVSGDWVGRAGHGTLWQDGYWRRTGNSEAWLPAHWI